MSRQIDQSRPQLTAWAFGAAEEEALPNDFRALPTNRRECVLHFRKHALCFRRRDRKSSENLQQECSAARKQLAALHWFSDDKAVFGRQSAVDFCHFRRQRMYSCLSAIAGSQTTPALHTHRLYHSADSSRHRRLTHRRRWTSSSPEWCHCDAESFLLHVSKPQRDVLADCVEGRVVYVDTIVVLDGCVGVSPSSIVLKPDILNGSYAWSLQRHA